MRSLYLPRQSESEIYPIEGLFFGLSSTLLPHDVVIGATPIPYAHEPFCFALDKLPQYLCHSICAWLVLSVGLTFFFDCLKGYQSDCYDLMPGVLIFKYSPMLKPSFSAKVIRFVGKGFATPFPHQYFSRPPTYSFRISFVKF